jgi:hypothetical protein
MRPIEPRIWATGDPEPNLSGSGEFRAVPKRLTITFVTAKGIASHTVTSALMGLKG